jgi:hypothetical protein
VRLSRTMAHQNGDSFPRRQVQDGRLVAEKLVRCAHGYSSAERAATLGAASLSLDVLGAPLGWTPSAVLRIATEAPGTQE